jgi:hypothetical protein
MINIREKRKGHMVGLITRKGIIAAYNMELHQKYGEQAV